MSGLKHETKAGQNIMQIVSDVILLKRAAAYSDAERQKFEFDWNDAYLLLTEQSGALEEEKKRLAAISKRAYDMAKRTEIIKARVYKFFHSDQLRWAIMTIIIVMVVYVIPAYIWSYRNFASIKYAQPIYAKVVNFVYRPYLSVDYEYNDMSEVEIDKTYKLPNRVEMKSSSDLTLENFRNQWAFLMGFDPQDPEIKELLSTKLCPVSPNFASDRLIAEAKDIYAYRLLFKSTADAKRFIELTRLNMAKMDQQKKDKILNSVFAMRRANFVTIGISDHVMRMYYAKDKYKFKPETPNALDEK
jgi:hypothetical protein